MNEDACVDETDMVHPFGQHINWNESFYFNFYDKEEDIGGFMRIGLKPNSGLKNMFCYLMLPDGATLGTRDQERFAGPDFRVKGLSLERIRPEREWRLRYKGAMRHSLRGATQTRDVSFDFTYLALNKTFNYRECGQWDRELVPLMAAAEHTEQFGSVKGVLNVGVDEIRIGGLGERDHSWGVRDWIAPTTWIWLSCQFSEKKAFNLTKLMDKDVADAGYLHSSGENKCITKVVISTDQAPGGEPQALRIWFWDMNRETHKLEGQVLRTVKIPFTETIERTNPVMYESLVRFREGDEIGYGVAEYLTRGL